MNKKLTAKNTLANLRKQKGILLAGFSVSPHITGNLDDHSRKGQGSQLQGSMWKGGMGCLFGELP
jgi:hypothetical protein